jgi:hypothetical protein
VNIDQIWLVNDHKRRIGRNYFHYSGDGPAFQTGGHASGPAVEIRINAGSELHQQSPVTGQAKNRLRPMVMGMI